MGELIYRPFKSCKVYPIPHAEQAYPTCGDWREGPEGEWIIYVSRQPDWRYEVLVAVHEMIEMAICKHRHIPEEVVTAFDRGYEAAREAGNTEEPGDDPASPYREAHQFATMVERLLADELTVSWPAYEGALEELG
ncbi:MAG: hypothetical protein PVSMB1_06680 [Gemmatimonadaceae bacterium]